MQMKNLQNITSKKGVGKLIKKKATHENYTEQGTGTGTETQSILSRWFTKANQKGICVKKLLFFLTLFIIGTTPAFSNDFFDTKKASEYAKQAVPVFIASANSQEKEYREILLRNTGYFQECVEITLQRADKPFNYGSELSLVRKMLKKCTSLTLYGGLEGKELGRFLDPDDNRTPAQVKKDYELTKEGHNNCGLPTKVNGVFNVELFTLNFKICRAKLYPQLSPYLQKIWDDAHKNKYD